MHIVKGYMGQSRKTVRAKDTGLCRQKFWRTGERSCKSCGSVLKLEGVGPGQWRVSTAANHSLFG